MSYYVYKITNSSNGKFYVGKTNDLQKRWYNHVYCALVEKEKTHFYNAIRKYGAKNFLVEVIEEHELEEQALEREMYWIDTLKSNDRVIGYNITNGGEGTSGLKHTEETKRKIAVAHLGKKHSKKTKMSMSVAHKGKVLSSETKNKISQANVGENNGMYGKTISEETRNKLSNFQSSRPRKALTEEHKRKNREAAAKQDRSYHIPIEIKNEIIKLYATCEYTKRQLSNEFNIKYNSIVKILRS